jgi:hypothetical protein
MLQLDSDCMMMLHGIVQVEYRKATLLTGAETSG